MVHACLSKLKKSKHSLYFTFVFSLIAVVHLPLLFNTGIYFDGWMLYDWIETDNWTECLEFYERLGMPLMAYWYWGAASLFGFPLSYKILSYFWILLGSVLTYQTFKLSNVFEFNTRLWIILIANLSPLLVTVIEPTHFCYHSGYFLFQLASFLFLLSERKTSLLLRLMALVVFFASFNYNALLTYYYALWLIWVLFKWTTLNKSLTKTIKYIFVTRLDFSLLPLIFWVWKQIFTPVLGDQLAYNSIQLNAQVIGPLIRLPYVIFMQLYESFSFLPVQWSISFLIVSSIVFYFKHTKNSPSQSSHLTKWMLLGGTILFMGATFPYVVAVKGFSIGLNSDRMNFLYTFSLSVIIVSIAHLSVTFSKKIIFTHIILSFIVLSFSLHTFSRYLSWQVRAIKDESVILHIKENRLLSQAEIFTIDDRFEFKDRFDDRYWYIPHQPTFMMAGIGGGMQWLGIPKNSTTKGLNTYTQDDMISFIHKFKLSYYTHHIDLNGRQAILTIEPSILFSDDPNFVFEYYYLKFFKPAQLKNYLRGVSKIRFELKQ